jgi:hypothetical protein
MTVSFIMLVMVVNMRVKPRTRSRAEFETTLHIVILRFREVRFWILRGVVKEEKKRRSERQEKQTDDIEVLGTPEEIGRKEKVVNLRNKGGGPVSQVIIFVCVTYLLLGKPSIHLLSRQCALS